MGNTDLNTACSPTSSRRSGATSFCRNCSYDCRWISMRFGILTVDGIFPKSLRVRRPHWIVPAILPPRYEVRSSNVNELVLPCGGSLDFNGGADLLELLLHVGRVRLGDLLLHRLGCAAPHALCVLVVTHRAATPPAAADTPHFSCKSFESWAASSSVSPSSFSAISSMLVAIFPRPPLD